MSRQLRFRLLSLPLLFCLTGGADAQSVPTPDSPNILLIIVDDLNDWVEPLEGHPDTQTPALNQLAQQGVVFTRAYAAAPACGPSRTALFTGVRPSTSGVYLNQHDWTTSPALPQAHPMPARLRQNGYRTLVAGKVFDAPPSLVMWDETFHATASSPSDLNLTGMGHHGQIDWGPIDVTHQQTADWEIAQWVGRELNLEHRQPFFIACGFSSTHLPWYPPAEYLRRFVEQPARLPAVREDDLDDLSDAARAIATGDQLHRRITKAGAWQSGVEAYLAAITHIDDCVQQVWSALQRSRYRDNTVVLFTSDQGFHLGEKSHWRKWTLWEEATHVPLIVCAPWIQTPGSRCDAQVSLVDCYPTLLDLCGIAVPPELEGHSLVPQLERPDQPRPWPSFTSRGQYQHAARWKNWNYLRYQNGSEELYDIESDPHEWVNLAADPRYSEQRDFLRSTLPAAGADPVVEAASQRPDFSWRKRARRLRWLRITILPAAGTVGLGGLLGWGLWSLIRRRR